MESKPDICGVSLAETYDDFKMRDFAFSCPVSWLTWILFRSRRSWYDSDNLLQYLSCARTNNFECELCRMNMSPRQS